MRPNDENGKLAPELRPYRVLIISASQRRQYSCPGVDSKSRMLMLRMADRLPQDWEIDYEDLANVHGRMRIQPCNGCVSTSMALCCWPCNCYEKGNRKEPDLMWELDLYARLDLADAWAIIGPVNWYGPTTNLKAMFDRLVCMNGGNPREALIPRAEPEAKRETHEAIVWQCRFSGIEVPDDLWHYQRFGMGRKYSDNQAEDMAHDGVFMQGFDAWGRPLHRVRARQGKGAARQVSCVRLRAARPLLGRHEAHGARPDAALGQGAREFLSRGATARRLESRPAPEPQGRRGREAAEVAAPTSSRTCSRSR